MASNPFKVNAPAIKTGIQGSIDAIVGEPELPEINLPEVEEGGYLSYHTSYVLLKNGGKVAGINTDRGFYYPASLGEEAMKELAALEKRGFAYALK